MPTIYRRLRVEVPEEVIATAVSSDSGHCMIADAMRRAHPEWKHISVDLATIRFTDTRTGTRYVYLTPRLAQLSLLRFDHGSTVRPFVVQSSNPAQVLPPAVPLPKPAKGSTRITANGEKRGRGGHRPTGKARIAPKPKGQPQRRPVFVGGKPMPAIGVLAHSRGRLRQFGIRAATGEDLAEDAATLA